MARRGESAAQLCRMCTSFRLERGVHFPASKDDLLERARGNGAGQDVLEVLESFPEDEEFETLADVVKAYAESDQAPQTGVIDRKP
jgi:Protein of unknown function (DUF2795)